MTNLLSDISPHSLSAELSTWLQALAVPMYVSDIDGKVVLANTSLCTLLLCSEQEFCADPMHFCHRDDRYLLDALKVRLNTTQQSVQQSKQRWLDSNGQVITCQLQMTCIAQTQHNPMLLIHQLTDQREHARAQKQNELLGQFLEHMNDAIYVVNAHTAQIMDCNLVAYTRLGYTREELLQLTVEHINHELTVDKVWPEYVRQVRSQTVVTREGFHTRKDGSRFPVEGNISYIYAGDETYLLAIIRDISHRKAQEQLIWKQANYDPLTNLPNRRLINDRLQQAILNANRNQTRVAILYLDLDRFKEVNDSLGHTLGDQLLVDASKRLIACTRNTDTLARLGGDEFTIVLSEVKHKLDIDKIATKIQASFNLPFHLGNQKVCISTSIGISIYPDNGADGCSLLKSADQAMYKAKASGRNSYQYFTPSIQRQARDKARIATELHSALKSGELYLLYQPIQCLQSKFVDKAEVLLRWRSEKYGEICPREFIPVAEENGLIVEIGDWVFSQVVDQLSQWRKQGLPPLQISINTATVQFTHPASKVDQWLDILKRQHLDNHTIALEISETSLVSAQAVVCDKLLNFHNKQMQIHLDNFGSGYSSLHNLRQKEIDIIKLDEQFVSHIQHDRDSQILCETLIKLAHKLDMKVVGKNVETQEQVKILEQLHCDYIQGHVLSCPITAQELALWMGNQT